MPRGNQSSIRKVLTQNNVDIAHSLGEIVSVGEVITANTSSTGVEVGFGNIIRVEVGIADTYVAFGEANIGAVSATTTPGLKLEAGLFYHILATDDFIRSSAAFARVEVIRTRS